MSLKSLYFLVTLVDQDNLFGFIELKLFDLPVIFFQHLLLGVICALEGLELGPSKLFIRSLQGSLFGGLCILVFFELREELTVFLVSALKFSQNRCLGLFRGLDFRLESFVLR